MITKTFTVEDEFTLVLTTDEKIGVFNVAECQETYPAGNYTASSYGADGEITIVMGEKMFPLSVSWSDLDDLQKHNLIRDLQ